MACVRQSLRTNPPFGEIGDPPLPENSTVLYEEEYVKQPIETTIFKQIQLNESAVENDDIRILQVPPRKKELSQADFIERSVVEGSHNRQRRSSTSSDKSSYHIDKLLQDENNDWYFEKILEKFENLRSKKTKRSVSPSSYDSDDDSYKPVERIIERRYYVKKGNSGLQHNQLTSTDDLTKYGKKNRQLSGQSSSATSTTCSQCSSSTPTYVENLRSQSDSFHNEIKGLKNEIQHLQTSQQQFLQQLQTQFQAKPNPTATSQTSIRPVGETNQTIANSGISLTTVPRSRSISTESLASSASSKATTLTSESTTKPVTTPSRVPAAPTRSISEFSASKNPSVVPKPPLNAYVTPKTQLVAPTSSVSEFKASRSPSIATTSSTISPVRPAASTTSSVQPTPPKAPPMPINLSMGTRPPVASSIGSAASRTSTIRAAPPIAPPIPTSLSMGTRPPIASSIRPSISRTSSVQPTPPRAPPMPTSLSMGTRPPVASSTGSTASRTTSVRGAPPRAPPMPTNLTMGMRPPFASPTGSASSRTSSVRPSPPTAPPMPANLLMGTRPPLTSTTGSAAPRNSSVGPTPPIAPPMPANLVMRTRLPLPSTTESAASRNSSVGPTPPIAPPMPANLLMGTRPPAAPPLGPNSSLMSSTRTPIYENELAHRRILSPRSQIVASSASITDTSDSASSRTITPSFADSKPRKTPKASVPALRDNELQDLVHYSSHLESFGFPSSIIPSINDPNNNQMFWKTVDEYIQNYKSSSLTPESPQFPQINYENRLGLHYSTSKQLDKYDLEIKPQGIIGLTAPLLMPPLDISP